MRPLAHAFIAVGIRCSDCLWPVVIVTATERVQAYCSNPTCHLHHHPTSKYDTADWIED